MDIEGLPTRMTKPTEGRPTEPLPGGEALVGVNGNAYAVMGTVERILRRAGASSSYIEAYVAEATSDDYDHLLATSLFYLED